MKSTASIPLLAVIILAASILTGQESASKNPALLKAKLGQLPIYFIENRGVYPDEVKFYIQGKDKTLFFTKEGITFRLKGKEEGWVVTLEFVGANPEVVPYGEDRQQAVFSYFKGPEKEWKTGLRTYCKVVYQDLWPGIDLVYRGTVNKLKYEFVVKPGADPGKIRLRYHGATEVRVTESGGLAVETPAGSFEDAPPEAWQEIGGERVPVKMVFSMEDDIRDVGHGFRFHVGKYDPKRPLILDPAILVYCGFFGGRFDDFCYSIAVDTAGNAYVTGETDSNEYAFPVKVGPDLTFNGFYYDAFVAKLNAKGTGLIYCGYIGGAYQDEGSHIAVDTAGNAYVTGYTDSDHKTFPVKGGPDLTQNGHDDAFIAKVNAKGTALVYCGYIGGASRDSGEGVAVDQAGNAYITGHTASDQKTFPVTVGPDMTFNGGYDDAFVAKVSATGKSLVYCGYIGGANAEGGNGIDVDGSGNAYVTGMTQSSQSSFPVTVGPDLTYNGGTWIRGDAFVGKVNAEGTALIYCGYIGGTGGDNGEGIAVDAAGNAYVTGYTGSDQKTFPVTVGPDLTHNGGSDVYVAKVNQLGTGLVYCGYIGGANDDDGDGIAVDQAGNAYVTGQTDSDQKTFPVIGGPILTFNDGYDAFVAMVNAQGTALVYCGYIGGLGMEWAYGIAVDTSGNAYVTGETWWEKNFPVKVGPNLNYIGCIDSFVAKISLTLLTVSGTTYPGGTVSLALTASDDVGLSFQVGSSFGNGPISIDKRKLDLSPDVLLFISGSNLWPRIFSGYSGVIDKQGQAKATINIPNDPALIGLRLHAAFVTLDLQAPSGIKSISNTHFFSITK